MICFCNVSTNAATIVSANWLDYKQINIIDTHALERENEMGEKATNFLCLIIVKMMAGTLHLENQHHQPFPK